jgi:uncharacterized protein (TIGR03086 family)
VSELVLEQRAFAHAARALAAVVARIDGDEWEIEVPAELRWRDAIRTLRDLVAHHARDDAWVPEVLAGRTLEEVGDRFDGDLLGNDAARSVAGLAETAIAAVATADDLSGIVHVSYGDLTTGEYLLHTTIFRGFGAYDIARLIRVDDALPDALVRDLDALVAPRADALRALGVFGPAIAVPADASAEARLLALTGRDPRD